jgi:hypothetical protein
MEQLVLSLFFQNTSKIFAMITEIFSFDMSDINLQLQRIGVESTVKIVQSLVENDGKCDGGGNKTKYIVLQDIHQIIESISTSLNKMKDVIQAHSQKYFSSWRTVQVLDLLDQIKDYNTLLLERAKFLLQLDANIKKGEEEVDKKSLPQKLPPLPPLPHIHPMLILSSDDEESEEEEEETPFPFITNS